MQNIRLGLEIESIGVRRMEVAKAVREVDCKPISRDFLARLGTRPTMTDLRHAWYHDRQDNRLTSTRYRGINLHSLFTKGTIEFRWGNSTLHAGKVKTYVQFGLALSAKAISARATSAKRRPFDPATSKYDFRVFLLSLGLVGPEFKTARHHLLRNLGGSAAWKGTRRHRPSANTTSQEGYAQ